MQAINENAYRLVVIDTISRALGRADQLDQGDMNVTFGALQRLAMEREFGLILVDHHRKSAGGAGDVIDDVMGATSKVGVADCAMGIYRERGQSTATLKVAGRDVDDQELALRWDATTFCWQLADTSGVKAESVQSDILTVIKELGGTATVQRVANWLNRPKQNIHREMQELVTKGLLLRGRREGKAIPYTLATEGAEEGQAPDTLETESEEGERL
jgi:RecA-family ATPase